MATRHVPNFLTPRGKLVRPCRPPSVVPTAEAQRPTLSVEKVSHQCQGLAPAYCPGTIPGPSHTGPLKSASLGPQALFCSGRFLAGEGIGSKGTDVSVISRPPLQMPQTDGFKATGWPQPSQHWRWSGRPRVVSGDAFPKEAREQAGGKRV